MFELFCEDCLDLLYKYPDDHFDLVFCSPPYEDARTYGMDYLLKGEQWVDWCMPRYLECVRVCKGLVCWVVNGRTRKFQWSATPALLMADLHRCGVKLRNPAVFYRYGIAGSGGPDWLRNNYEFIVCSSKGRLPWSDNTAMGEPCKYPRGGNMTHRTKDGTRVSHARSGRPEIVNPGNVIKCNVGKGHMGSDLAHDNEAPFPESLAEFFVRSFCPPDGLVLDPFCGSGTTGAVAVKSGRRFVGGDIRMSQVELSYARLYGADD